MNQDSVFVHQSVTSWCAIAADFGMQVGKETKRHYWFKVPWFPSVHAVPVVPGIVEDLSLALGM